MTLDTVENWQTTGSLVETPTPKKHIFTQGLFWNYFLSQGPPKKVLLIGGGVWSVIGALPKKTIVPKAVVKKVVSIEEMMTRLASRVTEALKMSFGQFTNYKKGIALGREERVGVIVSFLAMLELVKQGVVHVAQSEQHGDIDIETYEFGTPKYD
jgi:hypothetical protein